MSLTEPVGVGLVASLARPGGNVTGVAYGFDTDIFGKQLALLKQVIPKVRRVAVLSNPGTSPAQPLIMSSVEGAARSLGLQLQLLEARGPGEFDGTFAVMVSRLPARREGPRRGRYRWSPRGSAQHRRRFRPCP
jgi:ABC-type uncharacterized transport system substrate-binding protein